MDGKIFCAGLIVGMLGGALIVCNSRKVRQIIKDGQEQIARKAEELKDEHSSKKAQTSENAK